MVNEYDSFGDFSNDDLLNIVNNYSEGVSLDYKEMSYNISISPEEKKQKLHNNETYQKILKKIEKKKKDLTIDLVSMANTNGIKTAIIITGVRETKGNLEKIGITKGICFDNNYQDIVKKAVNPFIQFTYKEVTDSERKTIGFFIIQNNNRRPYTLTISLYGDFQKSTIPIRLGSTNHILIDHHRIELWEKAQNLIKAK